MKSNVDLQNSDKCVVLETVSPQILDKLRESGLTVCICCEFEGVTGLMFKPGCPFDIHGIGYDLDMSTNNFQRFPANWINCETDVDRFINICLQFK